jgi:intracellular multiplication protein IcmC
MNLIWQRRILFVLLMVTSIAFADDVPWYQDSSILSAFDNLNKSLNKVYPTVVSICYITGILLLLRAFFMLKKLGYKTAFMHAGSSMLSPAAVMITGVVLMYTPKVLSIFMITLYGQDVGNTQSWIQVHSGGTSWYSSIVPLIGLVQVIGLVAFLRGWLYLMKATGENAPPGNMSKGFIHIIGGVMAVNITGTIDVVNKSLGMLT